MKLANSDRCLSYKAAGKIGYSLFKQSFNGAQYVITTVCCVAVLCLALLFALGVLQFDLNKPRAASGAEDVASIVSFSIQGGIAEAVSSVSVFAATAIGIAFVFTLTVGLMPPAAATLSFLLCVSLTVFVFWFLPHQDPGSVLKPLLVSLVAVFIGYIVCRWLFLLSHGRKVTSFFKHHVPSNLTEYYLKNPSGMDAVSESRELTILFCDIKRFTSISEKLDPDRLRDWLNAYFEIVSQIIHQHGGTVDKYMGDSVMAFWGAPWASETHAIDALYASRKIEKEVAELSRQMQKNGLPAITIGIGISTGFANVGHMGSKYHMTYTAVGDPVNTANRLQRCTGYYDLSVVVSESTVAKVPDYLFRELDTVYVKGRQRYVRLFRPECPLEEASPELLKRLQLHRKAMQHYRQGKWLDAKNLFARLGGDDLVEREFYQKYVDRIVKNKSGAADEHSHILDMTQQIG